MTLNKRCAMTLDELRALADKFFEWPEGSGRQTVTTFSALLFAQHVLQLREKSLGTENKAGVYALREAAQRQLEALAAYRREIGLLTGVPDEQPCDAEVALRAWLAQQAEPGELVAEFDHGIGADRFKVVRGSYWWHILIGDSPIRRGKFHTQAGAKEMAALLLREFRNGAFVQHEAALAEPVQEPVQDGKCKHCVDGCPACDARNLPVQEPVAWMIYTEGGTSAYVTDNPNDLVGAYRALALYTAPPQRKPLTEEEIKDCETQAMVNGALPFEQRVFFARAIERAHGIGGEA